MFAHPTQSTPTVCFLQARQLRAPKIQTEERAKKSERERERSFNWILFILFSLTCHRRRRRQHQQQQQLRNVEQKSISA